jgi:hypothetical protein
MSAWEGGIEKHKTRTRFFFCAESRCSVVTRPPCHADVFCWGINIATSLYSNTSRPICKYSLTTVNVVQ